MTVTKKDSQMSKINVPQAQLDAYAAYIKEDYRKWWGLRGEEEHVQQMINEFRVEFEAGSSYIRVIQCSSGSHRSSHSFICNKDGKFPKGSILKSAGWKAPATNFLRAVINKPEGWVGHVAWTGAH